ncbi:MAG: OmpA family protein [Pseudobacter sp.]|uniref:OmpA family protein n=1 Tax=Pseudobacter sp. TaxID=2045420 RepID=UPI003F800273
MRIIFFVAALLLSNAGHAQLLKNIKDAVKSKAEQKTTQKAADKTGNVMDEALDGKLFKKKAKKEEEGKDDGKEKAEKEPAPSKGLSVYSKFDFIPGEKVIAFEDFSQDNTGDFPAKWNTNASAEVVTTDGLPGKWLKLDVFGVFMPTYVKSLPDNFTLEMDVVCNSDFRYGSSPFHFAITSLSDPDQYTRWMQGQAGQDGFQVWLLPYLVSAKGGKVGYYQVSGTNYTQRDFENLKFHREKPSVKVSLWRQKNRIRVYLDEEKVIDVQKALQDIDYNSLVFSMNSAKTKPDYYLISNIRLAAGLPDTRSKFMTEGKFSTTAILFDVNSDKIKPSSFPVIKEMAIVLKENAGVRVKIIGHTDSDGDDKHNQALSLKRADAVKAALEKEFGIAAGRIETEGKGESEPVDKDNTPLAKASNRRVEFLKI